MGHPYMILLVMLCQTLVYKEVTALFQLSNRKPSFRDLGTYIYPCLCGRRRGQCQGPRRICEKGEVEQDPKLVCSVLSGVTASR